MRMLIAGSWWRRQDAASGLLAQLGDPCAVFLVSSPEGGKVAMAAACSPAVVASGLQVCLHCFPSVRQSGIQSVIQSVGR